MDGERTQGASRLVRLATAVGLPVALGAALVASVAPAAAQASRAARSSAATVGSAATATTAVCEDASHPALAARVSKGILAAMAGRSSVVGVAVDDRVSGLTCKYHPHWHFDSASVVKVTILSALLRKLQQEHRGLTAAQKELATEMITISDNDAASTLWAETGRPSLQHFLDLAKMNETVLGPGGYWGLTLITAHDELTLLKLLTSKNSVLTTANRNYVLGLMARVVSYERWGVPAGAPADVTVHVKNGWLPLATHGWRINSIGSFSGHGKNYMIVVLSDDNPTMAYGVDTVQDIAEVINHALNPGATSVIPAATPNPLWGIPDERIPAAMGRH
ncbi:MAG TPA: serine hydrolase [Streptosporangiaceae bacterium]|nr:serine hydrolase [Streptosporangiaceae bacterium]